MIDICQQEDKMPRKKIKLFAHTQKCHYLCISFKEERISEEIWNHFPDKPKRKFDILFRLVVIDLGF